MVLRNEQPLQQDWQASVTMAERLFTTVKGLAWVFLSVRFHVQARMYVSEQFEFQMEYYSLYDYIGCVTSKSYARYLLQDCKTMDDLTMVYIEFAQPSEAA